MVGQETKSLTDAVEVPLNQENGFDLSTIGIKEEKLTYSKGGEGTRYKLMRGLGSHWVSGADVDDARSGYISLPQGIRDAYKPHEVFWLAVAAQRYPELLSDSEAPLSIPQAVEQTLEERLRGSHETHEPAVRNAQDVVQITVHRALTQLDNFYATVVNGVQEYLARTKRDRDLKGALSLAVLGEAIAPLISRYEGLLANTGSQMPYKPY